MRASVLHFSCCLALMGVNSSAPSSDECRAAIKIFESIYSPSEEAVHEIVVSPPIDRDCLTRFPFRESDSGLKPDAAFHWKLNLARVDGGIQFDLESRTSRPGNTFFHPSPGTVVFEPDGGVSIKYTATTGRPLKDQPRGKPLQKSPTR
jgi:hypothetical protein